MIKINLLPSYVLEGRRIKISLVIFAVLLGCELGVVYKAYSDLQAQQAWWDGNYSSYDTRMAAIKTEVDLTTEWKGKCDTYVKYIDFFSRKDLPPYTASIVKCIQEACGKAVGDGAWFDEITIAKDQSVTMKGKIKGLMNFVNYYFRSTDQGYKVTPKALPFPHGMNQEIELNVTGKITATVGTPPKPPEDGVKPDTLYTPAGEKPAEGAPADGGAAPAPGGTTPAPAAAPTPAPASAPTPAPSSGGGGGLKRRGSEDME